jgi:hypothetical protein
MLAGILVIMVAIGGCAGLKDQGPIEEGNDGVVAYTSAHTDGVESELVVHAGHTAQSHPRTVEEVRRILLLHANEACTQVGVACLTPPRDNDEHTRTDTHARSQ